ncbi:uncharacterized protein LOC128895258 [Hylaeus anthracinus]|uniref:uncharacterized protein LOC128895258 n=1 Tax=Hylaeus anthracinus TaxID=313031 RepID=UPI0023B9BA1F|nr:uncharacterized protein LOC128895258 [Hylaeus anthracinus]
MDPSCSVMLREKEVNKIKAYNCIGIWEARKLVRETQRLTLKPNNITPTKEHFPPLAQPTQEKVMKMKTFGGQERPPPKSNAWNKEEKETKAHYNTQPTARTSPKVTKNINNKENAPPKETLNNENTKIMKTALANKGNINVHNPKTITTTPQKIIRSNTSSSLKQYGSSKRK